jgi:ParB-like chromosome segregation protein Spo0J
MDDEAKMSLRFNPQYEKIMPRMSKEEFDELKISIETEGQHYPIIANENLEILDGHHRFRACVELQIEPDFEVRKFEDKLIEKKFVIESNLRRRHLTSFQLVELGVPLLEIEKKLAKKRQVQGGKKGREIQLGLASKSTSPSIKKGKASAIVAKKIGLSTRTFERGKKIFEKASEEEKQKLREGKKSISKAYNDLFYSKSKNKLQDNNIENSMLVRSKSQKNIKKILELLIEINNIGFICPLCGNKILECRDCHNSMHLIIEKMKLI